MITYRTDSGQARVESSGEAFFLVTLVPEDGYPHEVYVAALFADEAAQKAYKFWYRKSTKLTRI